MKFFIKAFRAIWFFTWGNIFALLFYDKKYLKGRWFQGRAFGMSSNGWEWITNDAVARILLRHNVNARFPVSPRVTVTCPENIEFHPDQLDNFQSFGIYYQAFGKIKIGHGTYIGPGVGLITANHDPLDLDKHLPPKDIVLGENVWIGMNSIVLGGVTLGNNTIVGAGSVVTKSFPDGHCVVAGNPARKIKDL